MPKPEDYKDKNPKVDIRTFLNGEVDAHGVMKDRSGAVIDTFTIKMVGKWNGNEGVLDEDFVYNDGRKQHRQWQIKMLDDHNITATAADVPGGATGTQYGNAVNLHYVFRAPYKGKTIDLTANDWMYLVDEKTIMNHIVMTKYGFKAAELIITFKKK